MEPSAPVENFIFERVETNNLEDDARMAPNDLVHLESNQNQFFHQRIL